MRRLRIRGLRTRLMLVVVAGACILLALLTVAFNVVLRARLTHDVNDLLRQRASAHLTTLEIVHGRLRLPEAPDAGAVDAPIWVYVGKRAIERPSAHPANARAADTLAGGPRRFLEVHATDTRLYAVPIVMGKQRLGTLVSAASLTAYESTARTALVASLVFAAAVLLCVMIVARWAIGAALRPVAQMTAEAAQRSEHELDRRFALGEPHDELTRLAATFDALLDRLAASLRRERSFSAELSHELRTPLSKLAGEADLALRRERPPEEYRRALDAIRAGAEQMRRTLETLLVAARAETAGGRGTSDARDAMRAAAGACEAHAGERDVRVELDTPPGPVRVGVDADVLERILVPLIENGCRYAKGEVRLALTRVDGSACVTVSDDGPGVDPALREHLFEPGVTGTRTNGDHPGVGLGLALARRLARAASGDVEYEAGPGGAEFRVRLPPA